MNFKHYIYFYPFYLKYVGKRSKLFSHNLQLPELLGILLSGPLWSCLPDLDLPLPSQYQAQCMQQDGSLYFLLSFVHPLTITETCLVSCSFRTLSSVWKHVICSAK